MKSKIIGLLLLCIFTVSVFSQQAAAPLGAAGPKKANYAVVNLKCGAGVTEGDGELISDRLRAEIFNSGNVNVMERNQMQDILKEQGFQQSGATCTDEACLVELGQLLGVQFLVAGSLGKLGSMYMVNIRAIDVQTGKIVRAVSVDIKGDIEDLVERLPGIASRLTGMETRVEKLPPEIKEDKPVIEPKPAEAEEPQVKEAEEVVKEEHTEEEKTVIEETAKESVAGKNKNRSGIGFFLNLSGKPSILLDGSEADTVFTYNIFDTNNWFWEVSDYTVTKSNTMNFGLRFYIKAGSLFNIEIGPALTLASEDYMFYKESYDYDLSMYTFSKIGLEINYVVPAVHLGFDFVKRWFPLKMNIGVFANFSFPITTFTYTHDEGYVGYTEYSVSDDGFDVDFSVAFGARAGAEILAGPHVGFSLDFIFNWLKWETAFDFSDLSDAAEPDRVHEIFFPMFGLGLGVNFYF